MPAREDRANQRLRPSRLDLRRASKKSRKACFGSLESCRKRAGGRHKSAFEAKYSSRNGQLERVAFRSEIISHRPRPCASGLSLFTSASICHIIVAVRDFPQQRSLSL